MASAVIINNSQCVCVCVCARMCVLLSRVFSIATGWHALHCLSCPSECQQAWWKMLVCCVLLTKHKDYWVHYVTASQQLRNVY